MRPTPLTCPHLLLRLAISAGPLLTLAASQNARHEGIALQHRNAKPIFCHPPIYDHNDDSLDSVTNGSSSNRPPTTVSAGAFGIVTAKAEETTACQQPLATFTITHAAILMCPLCGVGGPKSGGNSDGSGDSNNQTSGTNQTGKTNPTGPPLETKAHVGNMENLTVTILNPARGGADIHCRINWDTSAASPDKFPVAKQMDCDKDERNQLNTVVEKQASGVAAGFYLFVWNNNQMETMAAWMVQNITNIIDGRSGWSNGTSGIYQRLYFDGHALLSSMPATLLSDFLQEGPIH